MPLLIKKKKKNDNKEIGGLVALQHGFFEGIKRTNVFNSLPLSPLAKVVSTFPLSILNIRRTFDKELRIKLLFSVNMISEYGIRVSE